MTSPFITAPELAAALDGSAPPAVLDASFVLHPAKFDGDYRTESGRGRWLAAHIPGSLHVDVATQFSDASAAVHYAHPDPQAIADELARLGIGAGDPVVVYDQTGGLFAARLWYLLTWIGVEARVLDGGLAAWQAAGLPVDSGDSDAPAAVEPWTASAVRDAWITREELAERAADDSRPLVCGLPAGSFTGADPTRYSRRGHIPSSVNVSARDLFAADGTVKAAGELREAYASQGVTGDAEVLLYCGGGISVAANALTLAELGVTAVRIYDGSLEEWSADPTLPLEVG
ncbi:sulfurtransferase [Lacisediminihabitans sp.]|uniref:sulfurtransferase n=1 Tax=Lacisediminihabitans sp. TaxID=2787631 RepID=UPI00374DA36B